MLTINCNSNVKNSSKISEDTVESQQNDKEVGH